MVTRSRHNSISSPPQLFDDDKTPTIRATSIDASTYITFTPTSSTHLLSNDDDAYTLEESSEEDYHHSRQPSLLQSTVTRSVVACGLVLLAVGAGVQLLFYGGWTTGGQLPLVGTTDIVPSVGAVPLTVSEGACRWPGIDRHQGMFWRVDVELPYINVYPRSRTLWDQCTDLERMALLDATQDATFTARLSFENETRLLQNPVKVVPGEYRFEIVAPRQNHADSTVEVDVALEMAWSPGSNHGMPCGDVDECNFDELLARGVKWSGQRVLDAEMAIPTYQNTLPSLIGDNQEQDLPICTDLGTLTGSWIRNSTYLPLLPTGEPCRLLEMGPPPSAVPRTWVRFVGDSNGRNYFHNYSSFVEANECRRQDPFPMRQVCWSDRIIVTFDWFYLQSGHTVLSPYTQLSRVLPLTLTKFLEGRTWTWTTKEGDQTRPDWAGEWTGPPNRTYLSIGSHSANMTTRGVRKFWTDVNPLVTTPYVLPGLRILKTSAAMTQWLAKSMWAKQVVTENNVHIELTNQVSADWAEAHDVPMIDLYNPVRGAIPYMFDALHQRQEMYKIWARLAHTDLFGEIPGV